eukprot:CAMPEP_0204324906 /NCGR_PEP_ID=MMETSP0469-20131031/10614_1 /ASSEMBLY_ACC=CAM_ASM_000384 /TAXON_ID=2969 /ORGANISM="Oxyrrhis marina" /LENGTH=410 /DNA_ID=CAMNT_0051306655 /DNA_START=25 /DNA_END=1257 /DNA_ORIENTATION=+
MEEWALDQIQADLRKLRGTAEDELGDVQPWSDAVWNCKLATELSARLPSLVDRILEDRVGFLAKGAVWPLPGAPSEDEVAALRQQVEQLATKVDRVTHEMTDVVPGILAGHFDHIVGRLPELIQPSVELAVDLKAKQWSEQYLVHPVCAGSGELAPGEESVGVAQQAPSGSPSSSPHSPQALADLQLRIEKLASRVDKMAHEIGDVVPGILANHFDQMMAKLPELILPTVAMAVDQKSKEFNARVVREASPIDDPVAVVGGGGEPMPCACHHTHAARALASVSSPGPGERILVPSVCRASSPYTSPVRRRISHSSTMASPVSQTRCLVAGDWPPRPGSTARVTRVARRSLTPVRYATVRRAPDSCLLRSSSARVLFPDDHPRAERTARSPSPTPLNLRRLVHVWDGRGAG